MIKISPSPKLLLLPAVILLLGLLALFLISLGNFLKIFLLLFLLVYLLFQAFSLMQLNPRCLVGFTFPQEGKKLWQLYLKTGRAPQANLLGSTRISANVIILHFKVEQSTMRIYQIILPEMIGKQNFHNLLVYLKIT